MSRVCPTCHSIRFCSCAPSPTPEPAPLAESIDLFGAGAVRAPSVNESETSQAAADEVDVRGQCSAILVFILERMPRPFTDDELIEAAHEVEYKPGRTYGRNSPRARRVDLTDGPLKQMTDQTWQRQGHQGGYLEIVGRQDGKRALYDITDKTRLWNARRLASNTRQATIDPKAQGIIGRGEAA